MVLSLFVGAYVVFMLSSVAFFFFFNDPATTEFYTLSLHDALPISVVCVLHEFLKVRRCPRSPDVHSVVRDASNHIQDRKSTRLNSSHRTISYAVFCLKKKNRTIQADVLATDTNTVGQGEAGNRSQI